MVAVGVGADIVAVAVVFVAHDVVVVVAVEDYLSLNSPNIWQPLIMWKDS